MRILRNLFVHRAPDSARSWIVVLAVLLPSTAMAAQDVKRPEEVFRFETRVDGEMLIVSWDIEPGYYLYRDKMGFSTASGDAQLGVPIYPEGEIHADEFFGEQVIFRNAVDVRVPIEHIQAGTKRLDIEILSQGCADFGLCYPPQKWPASVTIDSGTSAGASVSSLLFGSDQQQSPAGDAPIPVHEAFVPTVTTPDPFTLAVTWRIEPGYYLYRDSFSISNPDNTVQLGQPELPAGVMEMDVEFGETEVYYDEVVMRVPLSRASPEPQLIELELGYQGCKKDSICYPPETILQGVDLPRATAGDAPSQRSAPVSEQDRLFGVVADASLLTMMTIFLGLGLLLAFTPWAGSRV